MPRSPRNFGTRDGRAVTADEVRAELIEFHKARITRASEQVKRACDRRDYDTAGAWVRQFAIEVKRLNAIDPHGRTVQ